MLIALADLTAPRVTITGSVVAAEDVGGVLVVAESGGVGHSAVFDITGAYATFDVPPGDHEVRGHEEFSDTFGRGEVPPGLRAPRTGPVSV